MQVDRKPLELSLAKLGTLYDAEYCGTFFNVFELPLSFAFDRVPVTDPAARFGADEDLPGPGHICQASGEIDGALARRKNPSGAVPALELLQSPSFARFAGICRILTNPNLALVAGRPAHEMTIRWQTGGCARLLLTQLRNCYYDNVNIAHVTMLSGHECGRFRARARRGHPGSRDDDGRGGPSAGSWRFARRIMTELPAIVTTPTVGFSTKAGGVCCRFSADAATGGKDGNS